MQDLQEVFEKIKGAQKEQKQIKKMYRDVLESTPEYQKIKEDLEQLKTRKKQLEENAWADTGNRDKFETLKLDIKQYKEMLSDISITNLMKGETIKITDSDNQEYEPVFSVRFKKA